MEKLPKLPRMAAVHDLSGMGKCSLTVALPIVSATGVECCCIPTALLSTHTGGFTDWTFTDLSGDIVPIAEHWHSLGLRFDAIYSGYLASEAQGKLLERAIELLKNDSAVHGILVQLPLPRHLDEAEVIAAIPPEKDVDGVCPSSMARIYSGRGNGFSPCTAQSCMEIIAHYGVELEGKRVAVLGRSLVVGKPAAMLLAAANATVTIFHSRSGDYTPAVRSADIIVSAVGKPELFGAEYFSKDQTVIDIGISWSERKNRFTGDVDFDAAEPIVSAITPVPGGVGSVTTAVLALHVAQAAENNT